MQTPDFATMFPIGTARPDEAARFWQEKKDREDAEARDADQKAQEQRAKVIQPNRRKGPRTTDGVETK